VLNIGGVIMSKRVLSVTETAETLGVSRPTVYKMIQEGGFPAVKLRRRTVIPIVELDEWIRAQSQKALCATPAAPAAQDSAPAPAPRESPPLY